MILFHFENSYYISKSFANISSHILLKNNIEGLFIDTPMLIFNKQLAQHVLDSWCNFSIGEHPLSPEMERRIHELGIKSLTKLEAVNVKNILEMIIKEQKCSERRNHVNTCCT